MIGLAMAAVITSTSFVYGDCTSWTAQLVAQYPDHQNIHYGHLDYFCDIAQGCDDGFTHFGVSGVDYLVQHPNVHQVNFMQATCTVLIVYDADPIFKNGFE